MNSSAEVMMSGFSVATVRRESPTEKIRNGGGAARAPGLESVAIPTTADNTISAATAVAPTRLPPDPGHLPTAKRLHPYDRARRRTRGPVRVQPASLDFREESTNLCGLAAEDPRGQAVIHVVRDLNRVLETVDRDDGEDWYEELFFVDPMVPRQAVHDRGFDAMTGSRERLAARQDPALRPLDFRDRVFIRGDGGLVDHGPQVHVADGRVAHLDLLGLRKQLGGEGILHVLVNEDARARGALLTSVAERRSHHASRGLVQVCICRDDGGVLPSP